MKDLLLIGPGRMGIEYAKVLKSLGTQFRVIGRGKESAGIFMEKTGINPVTGGLEKYLAEGGEITENAIVAVNVPDLFKNCRMLLEAGVKRLLLEKPGATEVHEIIELKNIAEEKGADVYIGYNRRFLPAVIEGRRILNEDGGVTSVHFEFTEWSEKIEVFDADPIEKAKWFLSNSSHVADLAFFIAGKPLKMNCYTSGSLSWHPSSKVFSGSGITDRGALFSYFANWDAPGRWGVEAMSKNYRVILRPMEELVIQKRGTVATEKVNLDFSQDGGFKPGLLKMAGEFLSGSCINLCTLDEQADLFPHFVKIAGY